MGLMIVSLMVGLGIVVARLGLKTSGYVISSVYREVVHGDGGLQKFQKLRDNDSKGENKDNTLEVQGFILNTDLNQDIWMLTPYGIEHFTPLTDLQVI